MIRAVFLAVAVWVTALGAQAATFDFFFADGNNPASGLTVSGTITLPNGDGTFAATDVTITSAPPVAGVTYPYSFNLVTDANLNSFTVAAGAITSATFIAYNDDVLLALVENSSLIESDEATFQRGDGPSSFLLVVNGTGAAEPFPASAAVPLPASLPLMLFGLLGILGVAARHRARA